MGILLLGPRRTGRGPGLVKSFLVPYKSYIARVLRAVPSPRHAEEATRAARELCALSIQTLIDRITADGCNTGLG